MFEVAWQEFTKAGRIKSRRKAFATAADRDRFIDKLTEKDNFCGILGIR